MSGEAKKILKSVVCAGVITLSLAGGVREANAATITWHYEDDFSTAKAMSDSYDHTPFYNIYTYHPLPALCYWPEREILVFEGAHFPKEPAFLAYAFPFSDILAQVNSGTFELDVYFSDESPFPTYLSYQLSENGVDWTNPLPLVEGHNQIPLLTSNNGSTYIRLCGSGVSIDNLSVTVCGPERVKRLKGDLNNDGIVDFLDFCILASEWLMTEPWYND